MIRFALGFLTILCSTSLRGVILRENISAFFMQLYNRLIIGDYRDEYAETLLGPFVTALMAAGEHFHPSRPLGHLTEGEEFWRLCLEQSIGNFHSSCEHWFIPLFKLVDATL